MTDQRNPYSHYNYESFDRASSPRRRRDGERLTSRLTNPAVAMGALLITAAAFAGIIIISYPSKQDQNNVPTIQADAGDLRQQPEDRGGFEVAHQDSTVFSNIRSSELKETPPVEDLLAEQKPIDKLEAFSKQAESMFDKDKVPQPSTVTAADDNIGAPDAKAAAAADDDESPAEITENDPIPQGTPANDNTATAGTTKTASAAAAPAPASSSVKGPAGTSPDTLAYVKSVLNEKDNKAKSEVQAINTKAAVTQPEIQKIEPAAGTAGTSAKAIGGSYYVQLGSVTSESGASVEWKRLQKSFPSLAGAQYRVQKADLGERGIRYRIQAGPMDKQLASTVCDSIKAQKPGGCLLVQ